MIFSNAHATLPCFQGYGKEILQGCIYALCWVRRWKVFTDYHFMLWSMRDKFVHTVILSCRTISIINTHKINQYFRKYFWIIYLHDLFQQLSPYIDYMLYKVAIHSVCVEFTDFVFTECSIVLATVKGKSQMSFCYYWKPMPSLSRMFLYTCYGNRQGNTCIALVFVLFYPFLLFLD